MLIYRGSTNEHLPGEGVAYDSYYNETDRVRIKYRIVSNCGPGGQGQFLTMSCSKKYENAKFNFILWRENSKYHQEITNNIMELPYSLQI